MRSSDCFKQFFSLLSILLMITLGCNANANDKHSSKHYVLPIISDLPIRVTSLKRVVSDGRAVNLTVSHQSKAGKPILEIHNSHNPAYVEAVLKRSSELMTLYLEEKGLEKRDCRGYEYNLNVIVVKREVLQSNQRFRSFYLKRFGKPSVSGHTLYGYYDTTPEVKNQSTILVTNIGSYINEEVLAHEIAHYWWDRLCLANHIVSDSETFAQDFDRFYMRRK